MGATSMRMTSLVLGSALAIAGLTVLPCQSASATVKDSAATGFTVENTQVVPVDARAGGCFCEIAGAQQAQHLTVTFVDPGKTLRMVGGLGPLQGMGLSGVVEFRLAPAEGGGTRITLFCRSGGYSPDDLGKLAPVVDKVQGMQLGGLADYLRKNAGKQAVKP